MDHLVGKGGSVILAEFPELCGVENELVSGSELRYDSPPTTAAMTCSCRVDRPTAVRRTVCPIDNSSCGVRRDCNFNRKGSRGNESNLKLDEPPTSAETRSNC